MAFLRKKPTAVNLFFCYAHEDEHLQEQLSRHLKPLERQGLIKAWNYRDIRAGRDWKREIDTHLNIADIILLLISANFMNSDYCHSIEMASALERHHNGDTRVIPILLKPVDITNAPFSQLQMLPKGKKAVTSWSDRDKVYTDIVLEIRKVIYDIIGTSDPLDVLTDKYISNDKVSIRRVSAKPAASSLRKRQNRNGKKRKSSSLILENTAHTNDPLIYKKRLPGLSFFGQVRNLLLDIMFPALGYFLNRNINGRKFRRYRKGIQSFGFFFFLIFDVGLVSLGVNEWFHSPWLTILAIFFLLFVFLWMSINEDTFLGIVFALFFGVVWYTLAILYLHHVMFIILFLVSSLFAFLRFYLFKPTR